MPGAGEEFPREQLNSAPAKNSLGLAQRLEEEEEKGRVGQAAPPLALPLHLDPRPGLEGSSRLHLFTHPRPGTGFLFSSLLCSSCARPLVLLLCLVSPLHLPASSKAGGARPGPGLRKRALYRVMFLQRPRLRVRTPPLLRTQSCCSSSLLMGIDRSQQIWGV